MEARTEIASQVDLCYLELRRLIISCAIAPGTRLTERQLIDRLGYGRTPVREALLRLDQDRLIDTMPRSGYRVRPLTHKSVEDFFDVWRSLAPLIARLGMSRLTPERRAELVTLARDRETVAPDDYVELSRIAGGFFDILVLAADNEPLSYIYRHLGAEMERIYQLFFRSSEGLRWLGTAAEIAAFANITNADTASRLIEARVTSSEAGFLAMMVETGMDAASLLPGTGGP